MRDNGIGIEEAHRERVFGLFDKLDPKTAGAGVGLAHVRRIVELHKGRVWVESEAPAVAPPSASRSRRRPTQAAQRGS